MKVFLLAVLCALAVSAYASFEEIDYDLVEDYAFLANIRARIQKGLEAALDRINALIEKHRPAIDNIKEKLAGLRQRITDLAKETGRKFREGLTTIRNKVRELLRNVLNKISQKVEETNTYALYDGDDQTPLQKFAQRIRDFIVSNFQKLRDFVNKHKELLTDKLKATLADLKEKISALAQEHGVKFLEHAREIGAKIGVIFKELIGQIGKKEEYALYAAEQEEESFLDALKRRVIERLQKAVDQVKDKLAGVRSDIVEKVLPKLEEIKEKLSELAKESGSKLLEIAGKIRQRLVEIFQQIKEQITGQEYYYADEAEEDKKDEDTTVAQRIVKRIQARLNSILRGVKNLLNRHKELAESFKDKVQEVATSIADLVKEKGENLREAARNVAGKIRALRKAIFEKITGTGSYYADFDIARAIKTLRDYFVTDEGIVALKANAAKASPNTATGQLIKAFILASTPDGLKDLIKELFSGINYAPISYADDVKQLVKDAAAWLRTDAGVAAIREYARTIQTSHPVVLRLVAMLSSATNDAVREVIDDIFTIQY